MESRSFHLSKIVTRLMTCHARRRPGTIPACLRRSTVTRRLYRRRQPHVGIWIPHSMRWAYRQCLNIRSGTRRRLHFLLPPSRPSSTVPTSSTTSPRRELPKPPSPPSLTTVTTSSDQPYLHRCQSTPHILHTAYLLYLRGGHLQP